MRLFCSHTWSANVFSSKKERGVITRNHTTQYYRRCTKCGKKKHLHF